MPLSPYIAFSGNCAASAELSDKITWGEMPQNMQDAEDGCPSPSGLG